MKKSIVWLRALACLLITNSHMEGLYPEGFRFLAFGGYFGDCLFFVISGYCLVGCAKDHFLTFSYKRLLRVYLPYLLYLPISVVARGTYGGISEMLFPVFNYHFIPTILTLYPLFYVCAWLKARRSVHFTACFFTVVAIQLVYYFRIYDFSYVVTGLYRPLSMMSYFQMMLLGAMLREEWTKHSFAAGAAAAALIFVVYVALFFHPLRGYAEICKLYLGMLFAGSVTIAFLQLEGRLPMYKWVDRLGKMTLEMYLVQVVIITAFGYTRFPSGYLMSWISIFACAQCLHYAAELVQKHLPQPGKR